MGEPGGVQRGSWRHLEDKAELLVNLDDKSEAEFGPELARVDRAVEVAELQFLVEVMHGTALVWVLAGWQRRHLKVGGCRVSGDRW